MKTQTTAQWFKRYVLLAGLSLIMATFMAGCGNKGSDAPAAVSPYAGFGVFGGSTGLSQMNGNVLTTAVGYSRYNGQPEYELDLEFMTPSAASSGIGYQGQVAAQGILTVPYNINSPCTIPQGSYQVQSTSIGQWSNGSFGGMQLMATNGQIIIYLINDQVNPVAVTGQLTGYSLQGSLAGSFMALSSNMNPQCQSLPPEIFGGLSF